MPSIVISRRTYERMKDAVPTAGILWESEGKVGFRKDGTVFLEIKQTTLDRLQTIALEPDSALSLVLDHWFEARRVQ